MMPCLIKSRKRKLRNWNSYCQCFALSSTEGTILDDEAYKRATSVYLVDSDRANASRSII